MEVEPPCLASKAKCANCPTTHCDHLTTPYTNALGVVGTSTGSVQHRNVSVYSAFGIFGEAACGGFMIFLRYYTSHSVVYKWRICHNDVFLLSVSTAPLGKAYMTQYRQLKVALITVQTTLHRLGARPLTIRVIW